MSDMDVNLTARRLIEELLYRWGLARDADDWEALEACFQADAQINISWISAPASEFVARSREMAALRRKGAHMKHVISGPRIEVQGERGISACNVILYIRDCNSDVWFDIESHIRFFDRLECRGGTWRIVERIGVYDKDRIDVVYPGQSLNTLPGIARLGLFKVEAQFLCWWLGTKGLQAQDDLTTVYSDAEGRLHTRLTQWLHSYESFDR